MLQGREYQSVYLKVREQELLRTAGPEEVSPKKGVVQLRQYVLRMRAIATLFPLILALLRRF